jgi:hypothetical protein
MKIAALGTLAAAGLCAAELQTVTYVAGNLNGVNAGVAAKLNMTAPKEMVLVSRDSQIPVPYKSIVNAELSDRVSHTPEVPVYKIWALHKRFLDKAPDTQQLTVEFKDGEGKPLTMTLEFEGDAAVAAYKEIQVHQGKRRGGEWWGDTVWKTTRNTPDWQERSAKTMANAQ